MTFDGQVMRFLLAEYTTLVISRDVLRGECARKTTELRELKERLDECQAACQEATTDEARMYERLKTAQARIVELEQDRAKQDVRIAELTESPGT